MNKYILLLFTACAYATTPLHADTSQDQALEEWENTRAQEASQESFDDEEYDEPQGREVSPTDTNTQDSAKKRSWIGHLILAGVAVVVAIVSMCIVANNNGKKQ